MVGGLHVPAGHHTQVAKPLPGKATLPIWSRMSRVCGQGRKATDRDPANEVMRAVAPLIAVWGPTARPELGQRVDLLFSQSGTLRRHGAPGVRTGPVRRGMPSPRKAGNAAGNGRGMPGLSDTWSRPGPDA